MRTTCPACTTSQTVLPLPPPLPLPRCLLHFDMSFCMCEAYHLFMRFIIVVILCFALSLSLVFGDRQQQAG